MYGVIYKATNKINGNIYIGQTIQNLSTRISGHISSAIVGNSDLHFHRAIRKYGKDNFVWDVIDEADTKEELNMMERYWIKYYNSYKGRGYNSAPGGDGNAGIKYNEEWKLVKCIAKGGREFLVFDLNGNLLFERINQSAFAEEIGANVSSVNNVLLGKKGKHSVKGYILIFKEKFSNEILESIVNKVKSIHREFVVFDKNNNYLGRWDNQIKCNQDIKIGRASLYRQLTQNLGRDTCRKFKAYYIEDIPKGLQRRMEQSVG